MKSTGVLFGSFKRVGFRMFYRPASRLLLLIFLGSFVLSSTGSGQSVQVRVGPGGSSRMQRGHWGLVKGDFINTTDSDREVLAVVMPAFAQGMQYGRRVVIPAGSVRSCQWPVLIPEDPAESFEFDYLVFDDPDDEGTIKRARGETVTQNFAVVNSEHLNERPAGYRGLLTSGDETPRDEEALELLAETLRNQARLAGMGLPFGAEQLDGYPEALESIEQLAVTSQTLHHFPEACDAIRVWTQRGGKTWLLLDQCGIDSVSALLGDALPLTLIDETSSNTMTFQATSEVEAEATVTREFDEPVRLVRVIAEAGATHWTVDGWPAVIELPYGNGIVMLTTVSPEVFLQQKPVAKSLLMAREISNRLFEVPHQNPRIMNEQLGAAAAGSIGYEVPSRFFAGTVMLGFAAALAFGGVVLLRRDRALVLLWGVPALACVCAVPAVLVGSQSRNVAPPTAIQQQVTELITGQTTVAADGIASVFQPSPGPLNVTMNDFSVLTPVNMKQDRGDRRIVWTDRGQSHWQQLQQDAGVRDYVVRSVQRLPEPDRVRLTLNQQGLVGRFDESAVTGRADMIVASAAVDRLALRQTSDGTLQATQQDLLAATEFVTGTLLTDVQNRRAAVYAGLFPREALAEAYPDRLTVLSWIDQPRPSIIIGDETTRQSGSVLLSQAVELQPPEADTDVTIPSVLLPYRTVLDDERGLSSAFDNRQRRWQARNVALTTWLKFSLPEACLPFSATSGELAIQLHAGSRQVQISAGAREQTPLLRTLDSPADLFTLQLDEQHLRNIVNDGGLFLRLDVSDIEVSEDDDPLVTRDDYWKVDRISLTLQGQRREP